MPFLFAKLVNGLEQDNHIIWTFILVTAIVIYSFTNRYGDILLNRWKKKISKMIMHGLNSHVGQYHYSFFQNQHSGRIAIKITQIVQAVRALIDMVVGQGVWAVTGLVTIMIQLSFIHWSVALILLVWLALSTVTTLIYMSSLYKRSMDASDMNSHYNGGLVDWLGNINIVKLFSAHQTELKHNNKAADNATNAFYKLRIKTIQLNTFIQIYYMMAQIAIVGFIIYAWQHQVLTIAEMVIIYPMFRLAIGYMWDQLLCNLATITENIGQVKDGLHTLTQDEYGQEKQAIKKLENPKGDISLSRINFQYPDTDKPALINFSLDIQKKQKVGLIGQSGAGKSTLAHIMLGLYELQNGELKVGGQAITPSLVHGLRQSIAFVPQDTSLFHRTLMDNIRYGRLDATDKEVIAAAKKAHAHGFISELPNGYETLVGERGVKLSGGQRQRIAIARAILKDAPILILDEATSALDSESEKLIQESLKNLMKGKTVIAIAHRLSTIAHLDRIIVMDNGQIIEDGTHEELLKTDGHYAKLWTMQSGGFLGE